MSTTNQENVKEIRVSGNSNVGTLSGYIHTTLNEHSRACIVAVGPRAISTAVKAIAVARQHLEGTTSDIHVFPEFTQIAMDDITVNGKPLGEEGIEIVKEAFDTAVNSEPRVHVGIRLFLEHCHRLTQTVGPVENRNNQSRNNTKASSNRSNKPKKKLSDEQLFKTSVGFDKAVVTNSNGIPRI